MSHLHPLYPICRNFTEGTPCVAVRKRSRTTRGKAALIIDDESKIPDEFKTGTLKMPLEFIPAEFLSETTITVDKSILAAAFPNGDAPGCHFSVISEYIRIK